MQYFKLAGLPATFVQFDGLTSRATIMCSPSISRRRLSVA
jgi:hypothetical protein